MKNFEVETNAVYLITDRLTREYFAGVDIAEGYLFLSKTKVYFTDLRYFYAANKALSKVGAECRIYKSDDDIAAFIKEVGAKVLYIDFEKSTVKEYFDYQKFGVGIKDFSLKLQKYKSVKTETEIASIVKACEIAQSAYYAAIKTVKVGMTELELKEKLETQMLALGATKTSFDTIVAFGENSAVPHHETGNTRLKENSVVLVDMGCVYNGYCSDITRTAFFGTPDKKFLDCYDAVLNANLVAEENITDKTTAKGGDAFARNYLKEKNLDAFFTHSLGHGVGQEIHEYPRLSPKSDAVLENGMVFTIEPGVYFDGEFGIRIEDTVLLENGKVKRLFTDDKKLLILKK